MKKANLGWLGHVNGAVVAAHLGEEWQGAAVVQVEVAEVVGRGGGEGNEKRSGLLAPRAENLWDWRT